MKEKLTKREKKLMRAIIIGLRGLTKADKKVEDMIYRKLPKRLYKITKEFNEKILRRVKK